MNHALVEVVRNINNVAENKFTKPENIRIFGLFLFLKICNFSSKSAPTYVLLESLVDVFVTDCRRFSFLCYNQNEVECMNYLETVDKKILEYLKVLEPVFPDWLNDYINTKELLSQQYISTTCGTIYSDLFESEFFFSSLDHAIAVALIIWHFTHDKKQTLSGLFHDIATPCFKHCIDFLDGDYMVQESTEDLTTEIIKNSSEIMSLLKRDNIQVNEVDNYHIYPIADNDSPCLSADRLEYSLSNGLITYRLVKIDKIKEMYNDICIQKDENGIDELGFKTEKIANEFVWMTSKLSIIYREDKTRYSMQFIADILKKLNEEGIIKRSDLYTLKESEVIEIIEKSKYCCVFDKWRRAKSIFTSLNAPKDVYYVYHGAKIRYIDPLVNFSRISKISKSASEMIQNNLSYDMSKYVYLDFDI